MVWLYFRFPLGLRHVDELPVAWGADWWASRPVWFAAYLLVLLALVRVLTRSS